MEPEVELQHEIDMTGVRADRTWFQRCTCGWETDGHRSAHHAAEAMAAHIAATAGIV